MFNVNRCGDYRSPVPRGNGLPEGELPVGQERPPWGAPACALVRNDMLFGGLCGFALVHLLSLPSTARALIERPYDIDVGMHLSASVRGVS